MKKDPALGNAFMDLALVGVIGATVWLLVELVFGAGLPVGSIAACTVVYGAYVIAAARLGVSPLGYLRNVWRRGRAYSENLPP